MELNWEALGSALALMLIIEGLVPFARPGTFRRTMEQVAQMPEQQLRGIGLASMLVGIAVLYFVR